MLAAIFVLFLALATFGGIMSLVAIVSDRPADKQFVAPSLALGALGTAMTMLILFATR